MARSAAAIVAAFLAMSVNLGAARAQSGGMGSHAGHGDNARVEGNHEIAYRNPGLAAGLSLTPVPVDFGNLYAGNIGWGIAYTALEVGLMAPMAFIVGDHGMGMGYRGTANPWTSTDRNWMIGLVSTYVVVKLVSGVHAAHAADVFNREQQSHFSAAIVPAAGGGMGMVALRY